MQTKPTFKNLIDLSKEKLNRSRSRSRSPNNLSSNKSRDVSVSNNYNTHTIQPLHPSSKEIEAPLNERSMIRRNYNSQMPEVIGNTQDKLDALEQSFQRLETKFNNLFNEVPESERFLNEETRILNQSVVDYQERVNRLEEKLGKQQFPVKAVQQELRHKITKGNRKGTQATSQGEMEILKFQERVNYRGGQLNLSQLSDRLSRLEGLID